MAGSYEAAPVVESYLRSLGLPRFVSDNGYRTAEEMALEVVDAIEAAGFEIVKQKSGEKAE